MSLPTEWLVELANNFRDALKARRILFVHNSALLGTCVDQVCDFMATAHRMEVAEFCELSETQLERLTISWTSIVVTHVDALKWEASAVSLSQLRALVQKVAQAEVGVALVSRDSMRTFGPVPGSSIILDSSPFVFPSCPPVRGDSYLLTSVPVAHDNPDIDFRTIFRQAVGQISVEAVMELDRALYQLETGHEQLVQNLTPVTQEELRQAGLLQYPSASNTLRFCVPARYANFRLAVADAISDLTPPPQWLPPTYADLFEIERLIRSRLRAAAIVASGDKWRKTLLAVEVSDRVIDYANRDGYLLAESVSDLRDPLEWITLGELVDIGCSPRFGGLGLPLSQWERFRIEVLPIRNRIGHVRLISEADHRQVRTWRTLLAARFAA